MVCTTTLTSSGCAGSLSTSMTMPAGQRDAPPADEEDEDEDEDEEEDAPVPSADAAAVVVGCTATGRYLRRGGKRGRRK